MNKELFAHRVRATLFYSAVCVGLFQRKWLFRKHLVLVILLAGFSALNIRGASAATAQSFDPANWIADQCSASSVAYGSQPFEAIRASANLFMNRFYPSNVVVLDGVKSQNNLNGATYYEIWWHLEPHDLSVSGSLSSKRIACVSAIELPSSLENLGAPRMCNGTNPINAATGNKFQHDTDYANRGPGRLIFSRYYNSQSIASRSISRSAAGAIGANWRHSYDRSIDVGAITDLLAFHRAWNDPSSPSSSVISSSQNIVSISIGLNRPDGEVLTFTNSFLIQEGVLKNDSWRSTTSGGALSTLYNPNDGSLSGFQFISVDNTVEIYDINGRLQSIINNNSVSQTLSYNSAGLLSNVTDGFGQHLTFTYDDHGRIESMTDAGGYLYAYSYDAVGRLISITYPDQAVRRYLYEDSHFPNALTGIVDENGNRYATWRYDNNGRAISSEHANATDHYILRYNSDGSTAVTNALGKDITYSFTKINGIYKVSAIDGGACTTCGRQAQSYNYDATGHLVSTTDFNGNTTLRTYNTRGLETTRLEAAGTLQERKIATKWHPTFYLPVTIASSGRTTNFQYNSRGQLIQSREIDTATNISRITSYSYGANNLLESIDGPRTDINDITSLSYDIEGNIREVTDALGHKRATTAYNSHGQPLRIVSPNGLVKTFTYDIRGRLLTSNVGSEATSFTYDSVGNVTQITFPDGSWRNFEYDAANRLVSVQDSNGTRINYALDALGNRILEEYTDMGGITARVHRYIFDSSGRLSQDLNADGEATSYIYDANGNRLSSTDALGNTAQYTYNELDQLTRIQDALGGTILFEYDGQGHLVSATDPKGNTNTFTYDGLGNRTSDFIADRGLNTYQYDSAGNLVSARDSVGNLTRYQYDALNRILSITYQDGLTQNYLYDDTAEATGFLSAITSPNNTIKWLYNNYGRVIQRTESLNGIQFTTRYQYDTTGKLSQMVYPSGSILTYRRNSGHLDELDAESQVILKNLQTEPTGQYSSWLWGNGLETRNTYDQNDRIVIHSNGVNVQTLAYDPIGNIIHNSDANDIMIYGYDPLNRLIGASGNSNHYVYDYDANGNRTAMSLNTDQKTYQYDSASNRLSSVNAQNPLTVLYDGNGNVVDDGRHQYSYDSRNLLRNVDNGAISYTSNVLGERTSKVRGSSASSATVLMNISFNGADGNIVDDQADGLWKGSDLSAVDSAVIQNNRLLVYAGERIRTKSWFADHLGGRITVSGDLFVGTVKTKKIGDRAGIKIRYNGVARVAVTTGSFDDATHANKMVYKLSTASKPIHFMIQLSNGTTNVIIRDADGRTYSTEQITNTALKTGDRYRLVVKAIKVNGAPNPALADNLLVTQAWGMTGSNTTYFIYDDSARLLGEYDDSGLAIKEYFYVNRLPVAVNDRGRLLYIHTDHLGTPQELTDNNSNVVWSAQYTPFGIAKVDEDPDGDGNAATFNFRFPGQYYDPETELNYNYRRYYDPSTGRYISSDPIGIISGINTYAYAFLNPLIYVDPLGLDSSLEPSPAQPGPKMEPYYPVNPACSVVGCPQDDYYYPSDFQGDPACIARCFEKAKRTVSLYSPFPFLSDPSAIRSISAWSRGLRVLRQCVKKCNSCENKP